MEYPIKFDKCPVCKSTKRIIEEEVNEEIKAGHLKLGARVPVMVSRSNIVDMNDRSILLVRRHFPVMIGLYDVCVECGTIYCVEMNKAVGIAEAQVKQGPPKFNPNPNLSN